MSTGPGESLTRYCIVLFEQDSQILVEEYQCSRIHLIHISSINVLMGIYTSVIALFNAVFKNLLVILLKYTFEELF